MGLSPLPPRRKQGQAEPRTRQNLPEVFSTQAAAWGSPAGPRLPQESPRRLSPESPLPLSPCSLPCVSQEKAWTRSAWPRTCCLADCSPLHDEVMGRQKENSASIKSYLRHLRQRCLRGDMLQRGRNKKAWKDLDEEAALFSD